MSDLVGRLRAMTWETWEDEPTASEQTCAYAAAEIERQQAEIEAQARLLGMSAERELALRGEIERLRAALEWIGSAPPIFDFQWAQSVARAALENRHG